MGEEREQAGIVRGEIAELGCSQDQVACLS